MLLTVSAQEADPIVPIVCIVYTTNAADGVYRTMSAQFRTEFSFDGSRKAAVTADSVASICSVQFMHAIAWAAETLRGSANQIQGLQDLAAFGGRPFPQASYVQESR